jgi:hypothetical protein
MLKKSALIVVLLMVCSAVNAEEAKTKPYEFMWINFGLGAGGVVSTNIINSGLVLPLYLEFCLQKSRKRLGLGIADELYITPENLVKVFLGNSSNVQKFYLTGEWMLIPNFPINVGPCAQIGGFLVGNDIQKANQDPKEPIHNLNFFGNVGFLVELGIRPVFLFVKPWLEFKSYGSFHNELLVCVTLGMKFKLMTEEEKARRAEEKAKKKK